jgi:Xaa-Pro aminopeptidase
MQRPVIRPGDLVAFDTDMIGPMGFCCDISRTFHTGPARPHAEQRKLYALAVEQIHHNLGLLKAGWAFASSPRNRTCCRAVLSESLCERDARCWPGDEWPVIVNRSDWDTRGYDGILEEGMVLSVESYVGPRAGGRHQARGMRARHARRLSAPVDLSLRGTAGG